MIFEESVLMDFAGDLSLGSGGEQCLSFRVNRFPQGNCPLSVSELVREDMLTDKGRT
jgi:hypothetical protein